MSEEEQIFRTDWYTLKISDHGRKISLELAADIRGSEHGKALKLYAEKLRNQGITRLNTYHVDLSFADKTVPLAKPWQLKPDIIFFDKDNRLCCVEVKQTYELGKDRTRQQLKEFCSTYARTILAVAPPDVEEAKTILRLVRLDGKVEVDTY